MAEIKSVKETEQEEGRNRRKTTVKNDTVKNGEEGKSAGMQPAGQEGKRGLSGKWRMQIFPLHLKTLCKLSFPFRKKLASGGAERKKEKKNTVLE